MKKPSVSSLIFQANVAQGTKKKEKKKRNNQEPFIDKQKTC
jgi:hypothetical protein